MNRKFNIGDIYWIDFGAGTRRSKPELIRITSHDSEYYGYQYVDRKEISRFHEKSYMATHDGCLIKCNEYNIIRLLKAVDEL